DLSGMTDAQGRLYDNPTFLLGADGKPVVAADGYPTLTGGTQIKTILFKPLLEPTSTPANPNGSSPTIAGQTNTYPAVGTTTGYFIDANSIKNLVFVPAKDAFNNPPATPLASFKFRIQDNGNVTTQAQGDNVSAEHPFNVNVTQVADAPAGQNNSFTISEDGSFTFHNAGNTGGSGGVTDFGFTDRN